MNGVRGTPRFFGEALDRYARYAVVALVIIPVTPDVVVDFADGNTESAWARIAVTGVLIAAIAGLFFAGRRRSARRHADVRRRMTKVGWSDILVLPLSLQPEYRVLGREEAESVPELLIDGADSVHPQTVVLLRSPQIDESAYTTFVSNLSEHRPSLRVEVVSISDVVDPEKVFTEVRQALDELAGDSGIPIAEEVAAGKSMAVDLTGATALVSVALARLAHELNAHCVYVSGKRGPYGRFVLGTQNRHQIAVTALFRGAA